MLKFALLQIFTNLPYSELLPGDAGSLRISIDDDLRTWTLGSNHRSTLTSYLPWETDLTSVTCTATRWEQ